MPSFDARPRSLFRSMPGVVTLPGQPSSEEHPTVPLPVPARTSEPAIDQAETNVLPVTPLPAFPVVTRQLSLSSSSGITRSLRSELESASPRGTVVIKGDMKKTPAPVALSPQSHKRRRLLVSLTGVVILFLITTLTLLSVTPLGQEIGLNFNPVQNPGSSLVANANSGSANLVAQATATAVYYQQNDGNSGGGGITLSTGSGSLSWPVGQCTYWANYRYHQLTGHWVSWTGNAYQWVDGARAAGWNVSQSPHVPSIIVLMPYVQGAYGYGHVAVVESANGNTVHTSNMNWWSGGGGWDRVSYADFTVGSGVYFIWHS